MRFDPPGASARAQRLLPISIGVAAVLAAFAVAVLLDLDGGTGPTDFRCVRSSNGGEQLSVSNPSGFYNDPFSLRVTSDSDVFYTIDGTRPELSQIGSTQRYSEPIPIEDPTGVPGPLSTIQTSVYFDRDAVEFGTDTWDLAGPNVDRGSTIRLRTPGGVECTFVYFIGPAVQRDLPVVHLTLNPNFLFDYDSGIYVPGSHFDENQDQFDPLAPWLAVGNYSQQGREWERPFADDTSDAVVMHYFEPDGALAYTTNVGVRIHGNVTRSFAQKSLRLYAREEYGDAYLQYPFFGEHGPAVHRRVVVRAGGNHCLCRPSDRDLTHLVDGYLHTLVQHLDLDSQAMAPVAVFVNGEYWGLQYLRDRQDEHYLEIVHGLDSGQVAVIEAPYPSVSERSPDWVDFIELLRYMEQSSPQDDEAYARVAAELDIDNFLDWLTVQTFVATFDVLGNYRLWRFQSDAAGGPLHVGDGRWRWFLVDLDWYDDGLRGDGRFDMFERMNVDNRTQAPFYLYWWLIQRDDFVDSFLNRIADHLNSTYLPDRTVAILDGLENALASEMAEQINRWAAAQGHTIERWHEAVDHLRTFMIDRPGHVRDQAIRHFDLGGTVPVRVLTSDGGMVQVNSLRLVVESPGVGDPADWVGHYFAGVPIQLEAIPHPGFRFDGWDGVPGHLVSDLSILVDPALAPQVSARFVSEG